VFVSESWLYPSKVRPATGVNSYMYAAPVDEFLPLAPTIVYSLLMLTDHPKPSWVCASLACIFLISDHVVPSRLNMYAAPVYRIFTGMRPDDRVIAAYTDANDRKSRLLFRQVIFLLCPTCSVCVCIYTRRLYCERRIITVVPRRSRNHRLY
jgi:hypothetical protein